MPDFSFLDDEAPNPFPKGSHKGAKGMVNFRCTACDCPVSMPVCHAGDKVACPMCSAVMLIPFASEKDIAAIRIKPRQISHFMWQISCPRCKGTTNFRDSSWGGKTKCRNCGFKMNLPASPNASSGSGCLGVVFAVVAVALLAIGRLV
jgi:hypothetical protein